METSLLEEILWRLTTISENDRFYFVDSLIQSAEIKENWIILTDRYGTQWSLTLSENK